MTKKEHQEEEKDEEEFHDLGIAARGKMREM